MSFKLLTEHHLEFLSLGEDCTGSSESTLVKIPHWWKSHVKAQICNCCGEAKRMNHKITIIFLAKLILLTCRFVLHVPTTSQSICSDEKRKPHVFTIIRLCNVIVRHIVFTLKFRERSDSAIVCLTRDGPRAAGSSLTGVTA